MNISEDIAYPTIVDGKKLSALVMCMDAILRHTTVDRLDAYEKLKHLVLQQSNENAVFTRNILAEKK